MGHFLDELERLMEDETEVLDKEVATDESNYDLEFDDETLTYYVVDGDKECCTIEFMDGDKRLTIDKAQLKPDDCVVYITDIIDRNAANEYEKKFNDMGFGNVSIQEAAIEKIDEDELNGTSNLDVIEKFVADDFYHDAEEAKAAGIANWSAIWGSNNLKISKQKNGWALINYDTPILFRDDDAQMYFNSQKYSLTTSKIQKMVKDLLKDVDFEEVDDEGIKDVIEK